MNNLIVHSDKILISAAQPGHGGHGHFNEQLPAYWVQKFKNLGYYYNENWEYQFNPHTNDLVFYNDGFPDLEPLVRIRDFEHLKQVINVLTS